MTSGPNPFETPKSPDEGAIPAADLGDDILAEPGERLFAVLIDSAITVGLCLPMAVMAFENDIVTGVGVAVAVLLLLAFTVYQAVLLSTVGQTVGKRMMGIKIVRVGGEPIDFLHAVLLRVVVMSLLTGLTSACGSLLSLIDSLFIFREDRRCIHDHLASTKVVAVNKHV